jgi:hypothetical protein
MSFIKAESFVLKTNALIAESENVSLPCLTASHSAQHGFIMNVRKSIGGSTALKEQNISW